MTADLYLGRAHAFAAARHAILTGGKWVSARDEATLEVINPADGSRLGSIPAGGAADIDQAVIAARRAFESPAWHGLAPGERARLLWRIAELIEENAHELAALETLDNGKPFTHALFGDLPGVVSIFRHFAGWCDKICGKTLPLDIPGEHFAYTLHEPIGVAGLITPWNYPLFTAAQKLAPALAAGCTVVLKPAELTSLSTLRLGELMTHAGMPDGVVNIVTGIGAVAGAALVAHPDVDKISFTGSTRVGKEIISASCGNLKKVSLELGGKSPTIILEDADLDAAIAGASAAIFSNSGQVCVAGSRLFASRKIFDRVIEGIGARARSIRIGPGLEPDTEMGPLVSQQHLGRVRGFIESGRREGACLVTGGSTLEGPGFYIEPTVLSATSAGMEVRAEEIFGPVLAASSFDDPAEIPALANETRYGLAANIWTRDIATAHLLAKKIRAGLVWINTFGASSPIVPFGGFKQSGWGLEGGLDGVRGYLEQKSVVVSLT